MMKRALATVSLCGLLLASISCGAEQGSGGASPLPKATHPAVPQNPDRDQAAVVNTLNRLNPCDLLPAVASLPATTLEPLNSLSMCARSNDELSVFADLGETSTHQTRFSQQPVAIAGVHGYLSPTDRNHCALVLPVSFTQAVVIGVTDKRASADACAVARASGTAAVPVLAGPRLQPAARWDACSALSRALGGGSELERRSFGVCAAKTTDERLSLDYSVPPDGKDPFRIAGKPARLRSYDDDCEVFWEQGPVGPGGNPAMRLTGKVHAATCDRATALATTTATVMNSPAPSAPVISGALTLRADQPDSPYPGGCDDLRHPRDCEPYHPVDLPKGADEIARQAAADPHVNCALAVAAVGKHVGTTFRPVYVGTREGPIPCTFVEPTHVLELRVELTLTNSRQALNGSPTSFTLADRPADRTDKPTYTTIRVAPTDKTLLTLTLTHGPVRGPDILPLAKTVVANL
ncbi:hypothetical protein [Kribbella soli]|uniref:DUF3558 domain-containing protein n=1 Tax=Kribbella soli TaxID=1124743 RepID=A0A4R0HLU2_9ACTN|nr:hypothetical protein [Kribbella soli]TCC10860.1 hypothetical protein E0H45_06015 [Kribbella soli]